MIYFAWILLCSDPGMSKDCQMLKAYNTPDWADCWQHADLYNQTLGYQGASNFRVWCSPRDYLLEETK